jgi:hypothetical protein
MEDLKSTLKSLAKSLEGDAKKVEAKVEALLKLPDVMEIEKLPQTMAWAMDSGDMELWLSIWSDDIRYIVPQYDIEINGKEALKEFGEKAVFALEERRFSAITNIMVELKGDIATGRDYYTHYGFPVDPETGKTSETRNVSEGMHFYEFGKRDGVWKITKLEVHLNRRQEGVS